MVDAGVLVPQREGSDWGDDSLQGLELGQQGLVGVIVGDGAQDHSTAQGFNGDMLSLHSLLCSGLCCQEEDPLAVELGGCPDLCFDLDLTT